MERTHRGETGLEDRLRGLGFNTVGNWSDRAVASDAGVPYTRQLCVAFPGTPLVYRDFPDVYHEAFPDDAADIAAPLEETLGDPAMIGYFLGNEPDWRAGTEPVAVAMLHATESCATRRELADWLVDRYGLGESTGSRDGTADRDQADDCDPDSLADVWNMTVALADVREGRGTANSRRWLARTSNCSVRAWSSASIGCSTRPVARWTRTT